MNPFQDLFDRQKRHFATGVTRSYVWRNLLADFVASDAFRSAPALPISKGP